MNSFRNRSTSPENIRQSREDRSETNQAFADVDSETQIHLSTPAVTMTWRLGQLAAGVIDG